MSVRVREKVIYDEKMWLEVTFDKIGNIYYRWFSDKRNMRRNLKLL